MCSSKPLSSAFARSTARPYPVSAIRNVSHFGSWPHAPRNLEAVHRRQSDVDDRCGRTLLENELEARTTVVRRLARELRVPEQLTEHRARVDVVFDDDHERAARELAAPFERVRGVMIARLRRERQAHRHRRALALPSALGRDLAAVHLDERAHEREADAETAFGAIRACAAIERRARRPCRASPARCRCRRRSRERPRRLAPLPRRR